jgi:hypothetical protein
MKLLTKLLADRLQKQILSMVHINQYGFLKSRTIQDCVACAFEYFHQCKQSSQEVVILKLDFAKAFDTFEHATLLKILQCKGFDDRWLNWIHMILSTGFSSILMNGVSGKKNSLPAWCASRCSSFPDIIYRRSRSGTINGKLLGARRDTYPTFTHSEY